MRAYIIHHPSQPERQQYVDRACALVPGLTILEGCSHQNPITGCNLSHQKAMDLARTAGDSAVWVLENDVVFRSTFDLERWLWFSELVERGVYDLLNGGVAYAAGPRPGPVPDLVEVQACTSAHCIVYGRKAWDVKVKDGGYLDCR